MHGGGRTAGGAKAAGAGSVLLEAARARRQMGGKPLRCCFDARVDVDVAAVKSLPALDALVVSTCLRDGDALVVAGEVRRRFVSPVLIVATENSRPIVHGAFELRADYLCTPLSDRQVAAFAQRAAQRAAARRESFCRATEALASHVALTPRERQIVELAIAGVRRRDITAAIGIGESTLKWHIRSLLTKCDATNLAEVVRLAIASDDHAVSLEG